MTQPEQSSGSKIEQDIIDSEGEPITDFNSAKPLKIGDTEVWYIIPENVQEDQTNALKVEYVLILKPDSLGLFNSVANFTITMPDGSVIERPMHIIGTDPEFTIIPYPADTDDEDDDVRIEYPPLKLLEGGWKKYKTLIYRK